MSHEELQPIEDGLNTLDIPIAVFIVSIYKTESCDIVAFDMSWKHLMPLSVHISISGTTNSYYSTTPQYSQYVLFYIALLDLVLPTFNFKFSHSLYCLSSTHKCNMHI